MVNRSTSIEHYRFCSPDKPDALVVFKAVQGVQVLTSAGAGHTFAGLDQKQGTMVTARHQAATAVEKLIGLPVQGYSPVRATIAIQVDLSCAAHGKQCAAVDGKAAALTFAQLLG